MGKYILEKYSTLAYVGSNLHDYTMFPLLFPCYDHWLEQMFNMNFSVSFDSDFIIV